MKPRYTVKMSTYPGKGENIYGVIDNERPEWAVAPFYSQETAKGFCAVLNGEFAVPAPPNDLLPCPFCEFDMIEMVPDKPSGWTAWCAVCCVNGPYKEDKDAARDAWNRRAEPVKEDHGSNQS